MIRGYFSVEGNRRRPFIDSVFHFPTLDRNLEVPLLVDTGADRAVLSPHDGRRLARRFAIDLATLPTGAPSAGVGGRSRTRIIEAVIVLDTFSTSLLLPILEPPRGTLSPIPSLLGRDILSRFALFMNEPTNQVLLLEPSEAATLRFP